MTLLAALLLAAAPPTINPRANELFDADPALRHWAVARFDRNGDGWLTLYEAQPAADAFRSLADSDRDGRVTAREFEAALAFVRARLGSAP